MDVTFIPGFSHEEQLTAWENGTPDEHRLAQWVRGFEAQEKEKGDRYEGGYSDGFDDGYAEARRNA